METVGYHSGGEGEAKKVELARWDARPGAKGWKPHGGPRADEERAEAPILTIGAVAQALLSAAWFFFMSDDPTVARPTSRHISLARKEETRPPRGMAFAKCLPRDTRRFPLRHEPGSPRSVASAVGNHVPAPRSWGIATANPAGLGRQSHFIAVAKLDQNVTPRVKAAGRIPRRVCSVRDSPGRHLAA